MKHYLAHVLQSLRRMTLLTCVAAFTGAFNTSLPQPAHANPNLEPPPLPSNLQVPAGNKVFLVGHAAGTQQYFCKFSWDELYLGVLRAAGDLIQE